MSWAIYTQAKDSDSVPGAIEEARQKQLDTQPFDSWDDDVEEQQVAAANVASDFAKMLDTQDGSIIINMSGHAKRAENDTVSISVALSRGKKT